MGQVIAVFGDRINQTALLSIVVYVTGNTAKYSADILFWAVLPSIVLSPFALVLVDRWNRRNTMIAADIARAGLMMALPLLLYYVKHHYVVYTVVFMVGSFTAIFGPCRLAILPNLLPSKLLLPANAVFSQAILAVTLLAMPLGGVIVENLGRTVGFLVNAITYLVSAAFLASLHPSVCHVERNGDAISTHPVVDLRDGLHYTWKNRLVLFQVIFFGIVQCLVAIFFICFLSYSVNVLGQTVGGTNLLFAALGIGMAVAAFWLGHSQRLGQYFFLPMMMMAGAGLGMLALSWIFNPWGGGIVLFMIGFCAALVLIPSDTFLQKHVSDEFRGRVFAVRGLLVGIAFLVSLQFSKAIIFHLGVLQTLRWLGAGSILISLLIAWSARRFGVSQDGPGRS